MYYLLYRRTNRLKQPDFLWFKTFCEKPTNLNESSAMFCLKIIESDNRYMGTLLMKEAWPEINVFDYGNLTY